MDVQAEPITSLGFASDQGADFADFRSQSEESGKSEGSKTSKARGKKVGEKKVKKKTEEQ